MYLISSSKLKKARKNWQSVTDYFQTIRETLVDISGHISDTEHRYLEPIGAVNNKSHKRAYIVVTADKGLAGAYNLNVIKLAEQDLQKHKNAKLFVVGQIGRHYFEDRGIEIEEDFIYSSQNPSLQRARNITTDILDYFHAGKIDEVYIIFTEMKNAVQSETVMMKLLPISRERLKKGERKISSDVSFFPNAKSVFNSLAPITMHGIIFSALTESYCAELNDRMAAMDGASKSAKEMLEDLALQYNRSRQYGITQEITEVSAGSKAQKKKK
jgi:F-type H+-transporting ATPase subunit gamma